VNRRLGRAVRLGGALVLTALACAVAPAATRTTAAQAAPADSGTTVTGTGRFADLTVTVSQTTALIDQVVEVSWTGGRPTAPAFGSFAQNYLQIMQCWGDDAVHGPDRTQCQYGGLAASGDSRGGAQVTSRQVNYGANLVDPAETLKQPPGSNLPVDVPFRSVTGRTDPGGPINEFYDQSSTNEIPFGRTRADGTGQEFMEVQTAREAPGLGCGEALKGAGGKITGRSCWLVIVPRDDHEVNGTVRSGTGVGGPLDSSPLSMSNWEQRIAIPLTFQPIGGACAIGAKERLTYGQESVAEAVSRWQPSLCASTGATFGYSQVSDTIARRQLTLTDPSMVFVSGPLDPGQVAAGMTPVYAPVAVSGLAIAFNIESQSSVTAPPEVRRQEGARLAELKLTPRLVAKLMTQSYRLALNNTADYLAGNPLDMSRDPDFLRLNPDFRKYLFGGIFDALTPIGQGDAFAELWQWVNADKDARAFLDGTPDPDGMVVNKNYKGIALPVNDLPKADLTCEDFPAPQLPLCPLTAHPYAGSMHDGARAASRGDTLTSNWNPVAQPPAYQKSPPQLSGTRDLLAISDTATAQRYGLPLAQLCHGDGTGCVSPTADALTKGLGTLTPTAVAGVKVPDPTAAGAGAYPLTTVTYAATVPASLDAGARKDYAALLRYAAGPGQKPGLEPGQLPAGYAPLPADMRKQALSAATAILTSPFPGNGNGNGGGDTGGGSAGNGSGSGSGGDGGTGGAGNGGGAGGGGGGSATTPPPAPGAPTGTAAPTASPSITPVAASRATPSDPLGAARYALPAVLGMGVLAAGAGPLSRRLATGRGGPDEPRTGGET
jgi:hypothetical protein